jgi:hypothetical protein
MAQPLPLKYKSPTYFQSITGRSLSAVWNGNALHLHILKAHGADLPGGAAGVAACLDAEEAYRFAQWIKDTTPQD